MAKTKKEGRKEKDNKELITDSPSEYELNKRFEEFKKKKEGDNNGPAPRESSKPEKKPFFKFPKINFPVNIFKKKERPPTLYMEEKKIEPLKENPALTPQKEKFKLQSPKIDFSKFSGIFKKKEDKLIDKKMQQFSIDEKTQAIKREIAQGKMRFPSQKKNVFQNIQEMLKPKSISIAQRILKDDQERKKMLLKKKVVVKQKTESERRRFFSEMIQKSGYELEFSKVSQKVLIGASIITSILLLAFIISSFVKQQTIQYVALTSLLIATLGFAFIYLFIFGIFFFIVDLRIFQRRLEIEDVLADYLQLAATNIKAGMPIDRALWYSVRPRFGILAKEIEEVAKSTLVGEELHVALKKFADKYDSVILKRAVELLIQGMEAGGEIGDLLEKIALNIQESKIMRREMSANVMTYVIFITFATIVAGPFMFGLSYQMLAVIQSIMGNIDLGAASSTGGFGMTLNFSEESVSLTDFKIFASVSLGISSFMSACIISTIQKGNIKEGLRYIPIFMITAISLFFIAINVLGMLFSGMMVQ